MKASVKILFITSSALTAFFVISFLTACAPDKSDFLSEEAQLQIADYSDYIVVANATGKSVTLFDPQFRFVRDLLLFQKTSADAPWGLALRNETELLVSVEGVDRIMSTDLDLGAASARDLIVDTTYTGAPVRGLAILNSGDILACEGNTVERYTSSGNRVTTGGWPRTLQTTGTQLSPLPNGGFIHCSIGTNVVRAYDASGTQTATVASGIAGTATVAGCAVGPSGQVVASYYGTTDTIRMYSSASLTTVLWSFSDLTMLGNPSAIGIRANGNVVVIDATSNLIVELNGSTGAFVNAYSNSAINGAVSLLVVR